MNAQELLVHNSGQREATEGLHTGFVDGLGVLVLALQLESEIIGQVATLVVPTQQPEGLGIVYLQRPQVEDAFDTEVTPVDVITKK